MGQSCQDTLKMLGLSKMRLCLLFALISVVISRPQGPEMPPHGPPVKVEENHPEDTPSEMHMLDEEDMKQLLTDLFISSSRDSRQLELDEDVDDGEDGDAADVADVTDDADNTLDYEEAAVDSDSKTSEEEVARFNNYIDAIYRRMNAALRAKMMDPMTLNLDDKQKKKSSKPRSLGKREADDEDEDGGDYEAEDEGDEVEKVAVLAEDELQDRAGKPKGKGRKGSGATARKNKKNKKGKKEDKEDKATKKAEREAAKKEKKEKKMKKQELREKKRAEKKKEKAG